MRTTLALAQQSKPASAPVQDRDADVGMRVGLQPMGGSRGTSANMWTVGCNVR